MSNILLFSLCGIFMGVVFGAAFLSVARTLKKESILRKQMIMAAYGFLLFYISGSAYVAGSLSPVWTCLGVPNWIIMLFDIFRTLFFCSNGVAGHNFAKVDQTVSNRAIKVA
jgi:hypothetical protein